VRPIEQGLKPHITTEVTGKIIAVGLAQCVDGVGLFLWRISPFASRHRSSKPVGQFFRVIFNSCPWMRYEHPVVLPHVLHLRHVPLRTKVKFPHSPHASPS